MANKSINADAICPFFITESQKSITCEGIIADQTVTRFYSEEEKKMYEKLYCTKYDYESCEICRALSKKYHRAENEQGGMTVRYTFEMP